MVWVFGLVCYGWRMALVLWVWFRVMRWFGGFDVGVSGELGDLALLEG